MLQSNVRLRTFLNIGGDPGSKMLQQWSNTEWHMVISWKHRFNNIVLYSILLNKFTQRINWPKCRKITNKENHPHTVPISMNWCRLLFCRWIPSLPHKGLISARFFLAIQSHLFGPTSPFPGGVSDQKTGFIYLFGHSHTCWWTGRYWRSQLSLNWSVSVMIRSLDLLWSHFGVCRDIKEEGVVLRNHSITIH